VAQKAGRASGDGLHLPGVARLQTDLQLDGNLQQLRLTR
jgi:hypothetical protein